MGKVLDFWFPNSKYQRFWFHSDERFDELVREEFSELLNNLENSDSLRSEWAKTARGCLALVICFDQLSRHIYKDKRGDQSAFKYANLLVTENFDLELPMHTRAFALMPFRHTHKECWLKFVITRVKGYNSDNKILKKFLAVTEEKLR